MVTEGPVKQEESISQNKLSFKTFIFELSDIYTWLFFCLSLVLNWPRIWMYATEMVMVGRRYCMSIVTEEYTSRPPSGKSSLHVCSSCSHLQLTSAENGSSHTS